MTIPRYSEIDDVNLAKTISFTSWHTWKNGKKDNMYKYYMYIFTCKMYKYTHIITDAYNRWFLKSILESQNNLFCSIPNNIWKIQ